MPFSFRISTLIPSGLIVGSIVGLEKAIIVTARAAARGAFVALRDSFLSCP
jgi:hypothetical protein